MSSRSETGHAKNVANFEDLISFCTGYGTTYNPINANIKLVALQAKNTAALAALQTVRTAKAAYDTSTNTREIAFEPLKKLASRVIYALEATSASRQTIDDAKTINRKIHGQRAKSIATPLTESAGSTATLEAPGITRTISVSQQSYDAQVDHLSKLIQTLTAEALYIPNETELKVVTLNVMLTSLRSANSAVITATTNYSNSRINRNTTLYADGTGLVDTAKEVKKYVKSVFGPQSPQSGQINSLQFKSYNS